MHKFTVLKIDFSYKPKNTHIYLDVLLIVFGEGLNISV